MDDMGPALTKYLSALFHMLLNIDAYATTKPFSTLVHTNETFIYSTCLPAYHTVDTSSQTARLNSNLPFFINNLLQLFLTSTLHIQ